MLAALVYARAAWLGLAWDDAALTVDNPSLRSLHGLWDLWTQETWKASGLDEQASYYRPVAMTSFWLVARFATSPAAHHVTNVLLHAANAALLATLLRRRLDVSALPGFLLASFWAVATAGSEAVLWISGRFDLLVTTLLLVALVANAGRRRWVVPLAFAGALLTKEVAVLWVVVLALDDIVLLGRSWRERWKAWAFLVFLAGAYLGARRGVGISTGAAIHDALGWIAPGFVSIAVRVAVKTFVPFGLDPLQPVHILPTLAVVAAGMMAGTLAIALAHGARGGGGAATWRGVVLVGFAWFVVTIAPMAVIPPGEPVAGDRYGYAASVGIVVIMAGGLAALRAPHAVRAALVVVGVLGIAHVVLTELRIPAWHDRESIARSMVRSHPENAHGHYLLGYLALERRDLREADEELSRALSLSRTWRALDAACVLELRRDRLDVAERYCVESATADPSNPRVWVNLASVYVKARRWPNALESANRAVARKPNYAEAHYLAAVSAANLGLLSLADSHATAGLAAAPTHRGLLRLREQLDAHQRATP